MTGDYELRGQPSNPGLPGKWLIKLCACVRLCIHRSVLDDKWWQIPAYFQNRAWKALPTG